MWFHVAFYSFNILLSALIFQGYLTFATHTTPKRSPYRRWAPADGSCMILHHHKRVCGILMQLLQGLFQARTPVEKGMGSGLDLNLETGVLMTEPAHSLTFSLWGWWWHSWFLKTTGQITSSDVAVKSVLDTRKKLLTKLLNLDGSSKGLYSLQSFQVRIKTLELMTDGTEVSSIYPFQSHALTHPQGSCLWSYLSRAWSSPDDPGELIDKAMPFFMGCLHC